jgi:hypothetical protein
MNFYRVKKLPCKKIHFFQILKLCFLCSRYAAEIGTINWQKSKLEPDRHRDLSKVGTGTGTVKIVTVPQHLYLCTVCRLRAHE